MSILVVSVILGGSSPYAATDVNRGRIFQYSCNPKSAFTGFGNIPRKGNSGEFAYDLNNVNVAGTISVTSFSPARFSSVDLHSQPLLVGQLSAGIEAGFLKIEDQAAIGTPLTRADLEAFL
jgi:hypothetical protein